MSIWPRYWNSARLAGLNLCRLQRSGYQKNYISPPTVKKDATYVVKKDERKKKTIGALATAAASAFPANRHSQPNCSGQEEETEETSNYIVPQT